MEDKIKMSTDNAISRLEDTGPLDIEDWNQFLENSKKFFNENWEKPMHHDEALKNFTQLKVLGTGSYGSVVLIKHTKENKYFAMKVMEKERILMEKQLDHAKNEKLVLQSLNFPMTIYLTYFFKNNSFIYLVMPYVPGGELFNHLRKVKKLDEDESRFYASQIILALEYLHFLNLIYRDLKPENILIDHTGYLKLTDFGFCKRMAKPRTYTLCGTPEYIAPELLLNKGYGKAADWWATGILIYELNAGLPPFNAADSMRLYEKIVTGKYKMISSFSPDLKDLLKNILQVDLTKRYGNMKNDVNDIKNHKWFKTTNWMAILNRKVDPKYVPKFEHPGDTGCFDTWVWVPPRISLEDKYVEEFKDF